MGPQDFIGHPWCPPLPESEGEGLLLSGMDYSAVLPVTAQGPPRPEPLSEVTINISRWTVDQISTKRCKTTTKRHKVTTQRCKTTTKRRNITTSRRKTTTHGETVSPHRNAPQLQRDAKQTKRYKNSTERQN